MRGNGDAVDHDRITGSGRCGRAVKGRGLGRFFRDEVLAGFTAAHDFRPLTRSRQELAVERTADDTVVEADPVTDPRESLDHDDLAGGALRNAWHVRSSDHALLHSEVLVLAFPSRHNAAQSSGAPRG